jgi:phage terminase large subunit
MWGGQTRERVISVDYGTVNPNVFLDWRDDGVTAWCYNEKRWDSAKEMKQKTDSELADDLYEFTEHDQSPQIVVDPSAASFKQELTNRGWWVTDAVNDVQSGISKTSTALAKGVIRFHRDNCKATISEFQTYAWDPKKALRGIEEPIKSGDHGPDAARYFCATKIPIWRLM